MRQLKGFQRVALKPGETQTLKFPLGKDELQFLEPADQGMGGRAGDLRRVGRRRFDRSLHAQFDVTK